MQRVTETRNVCFIGGPGTGKSTLAQEVNVALKMHGYDSEFCSEFARAYIRQTRSTSQGIHYLEQFPITLETIKREEEHQGHEFVVYDSASFVAPVYTMFYRPDFAALSAKGRAEAERKWEFHYTIISRTARERLPRFSDVFFVPHGVFPATNDAYRANAHDSAALSAAFEAWLVSNGVRYHRVSADGLQNRVAEVLGVLAIDRQRVDVPA